MIFFASFNPRQVIFWNMKDGGVCMKMIDIYVLYISQLFNACRWLSVPAQIHLLKAWSIFRFQALSITLGVPRFSNKKNVLDCHAASILSESPISPCYHHHKHDHGGDDDDVDDGNDDDDGVLWEDNGEIWWVGGAVERGRRLIDFRLSSLLRLCSLDKTTCFTIPQI